MAAAAARGAAARGAAGIVYAVDRDERESMTKGDATKSFDLEGRRTARRLAPWNTKPIYMNTPQAPIDKTPIKQSHIRAH